MYGFFAIVSFLSSIIILILGEFILLLNRKNRLNKTFAIFAFYLSAWAFVEFMYRQAQTKLIADLWLRIAAFFWPYPAAIFIIFALIFTENTKILKSKILYAILFIPSITITIFDFSTHKITGFPVNEYWGFTYLVPKNLIYFILANLWQLILVVTAIVIVLSFYYKTTNLKKKQQSKFIAIGFSFPAIASLISGALLPALEIKFPEVLTTFMAMLVIFVGYAISRYELFVINPTSAAENIVSTMTDSMILIDPMGHILNINKATADLLHYKEGELFGHSAEIVFDDKNFFRKLINKTSKVRWLAKNEEIKYRTNQGISIYVLFSSSIINDKRGNIAGIVCIAKDISYRKKAEEALKQAEIRKAYVDIFHAVTGGKLIIMTINELKKRLGHPVSGLFKIKHFKDLSQIRSNIRKQIEQYFPALENAEDFVVAVGEALTNTIKHAGGGRIRLYKKNDKAQLLIEDRGPGINFKNLPKATLLSGYSTKHTLGVGFTVMLDYCDRILLYTEPGQTIVVLEMLTKSKKTKEEIIEEFASKY